MQEVYYETLEKFVTAFASLGVSWETLSPGYGLAEATLKICSVPQGQAPRVLALQRLGLEQKRVNGWLNFLHRVMRRQIKS
jgi:hypothetical protein